MLLYSDALKEIPTLLDTKFNCRYILAIDNNGENALIDIFGSIAENIYTKDSKSVPSPGILSVGGMRKYIQDNYSTLQGAQGPNGEYGVQGEKGRHGDEVGQQGVRGTQGKTGEYGKDGDEGR
nr:MAG TPA: collagen alpha 1(VIII) chain protein [Bacteriophage sp.]